MEWKTTSNQTRRIAYAFKRRKKASSVKVHEARAPVGQYFCDDTDQRDAWRLPLYLEDLISTDTLLQDVNATSAVQRNGGQLSVPKIIAIR